MKILICILILLAAVVIVALVFLGFMVLFNDKSSSKGIVEYPMTFIEECKGDCTACNEEIKSVCENVRVVDIQDDN